MQIWIAEFLTRMSHWIIAVISEMGYAGVVLLMGIESACIPLPSEVIMPFAGYLASTGQLSLQGVAFAGAMGCVLGSIPAYYAGQYAGRRFIERYGRFVLISNREIEIADRLFARYGEIMIFVGRLLPVVRTFIAFPAGMVKMNPFKFYLYTFLGSYPWCYGLAWLGKKFGEHWKDLEPYFHRFSVLIMALLVAGFVFYVYTHLKNGRSKK